MPRLIRTSERTTFKRCRQQWWWAYVEELRPRRTAPALRFGTLVHKALELYYPPGRKRGPDPAASFLRLYEEELKEAHAFGFRDEDGTWQDAGELGVAMLEHYLRRYGTDDEYEVVASEQTFRWLVKDGRRSYVYVGTLDGIWRHLPTAKLIIVDHKTADSIWTTHLPLDEQAGSYWTYGPPWLMRHGILKPGQKLDHILYNFLRKAKPDARPVNELGQHLNKDGSVSKVQPPPYFHREIVYRDIEDRRQQHRRVLIEAEEMRRIRAGEMQVYKNPDRMHCGWCGFRDSCELHETGQDYRAMLKASTEKWDPYDAHEIEEEGK